MPTLILRTFKHDFISPKKHKPNTATAHMSYIMREKAMSQFQSENMPDGGYGTRVYFDVQANKPDAVKNARIADKLMIALPPELTAKQRHEVIATFMHALGKGRIAWCAAHHDKDKDAHNPHAHILFKDADILTGRKVIGTTTNSKDVREAKLKGWKVPPRITTRQLRDAWCNHLNQFMEREGFDIRYDARTLKEMGIDRERQIHIGPKAQQLAQKHFDFDSRDKRKGENTVPYSMLDADSRAQHNSQIIQRNREKEIAAKSDPAANTSSRKRPSTFAEQVAQIRQQQETRELFEHQGKARQALYTEQAKDKEAQKIAHKNEKKHQHPEWAKQLYAAARDAAYKTVGKRFQSKWQELRNQPESTERADKEKELLKEQAAARRNESDRHVAEARIQKDAAWKAMLAAHEKARLDLNARHREEASTVARQHVAERFALDEKWRQFRNEHDSDALEKRMSANGGMAPQQSAAMSTLKFRARQMHKLNKRNIKIERYGYDSSPSDPEHAVNFFMAESKAAHEKRLEQRAALNSEREDNIRRFPSTQPHSRNVGGRPRKHFVNGNGQDNDLRQAVASGRTLTDAERASASPELRASLDGKDRKDADQRQFTPSPQPQNDQGRGRPGGGRGR